MTNRTFPFLWTQRPAVTELGQLSPPIGRRTFQFWCAHPVASVAALIAAVVVLCGLSAVALDVPAARFFESSPLALKGTAAWITKLGLSGYMFAISVAIVALCTVLLRKETRDGIRTALIILRERAVFVFAVLAASGIAAQLLKHLVGRARPKLMNTFGAFHFDLLSIKASLASFPSGHATSVFAAATALCFMLPRWRTPLLGLALVIAVSRAVVGAHYVSDVVAGAMLGVMSTLVVAWIFANRSFAFERLPTAIRLRGRGLVLSGLMSMRSQTGPTP